MTSTFDTIVQVAQILGALLVLGGYWAVQTGRALPLSYPYIAVNILGSGVLFCTAILTWQWGFILLNFVWLAIGLLTLANITASDVQEERN